MRRQSVGIDRAPEQQQELDADIGAKQQPRSRLGQGEEEMVRVVEIHHGETGKQGPRQILHQYHPLIRGDTA